MGNSNKGLSTPRRNGHGEKSPTVHAVWSVSGGDTRDASGYAQKQMTKQEARALSNQGWRNGIAPSARDEGARTPTEVSTRTSHPAFTPFWPAIFQLCCVVPASIFSLFCERDSM